ncbi:MAG: hypothetical protein HY704_14525 [Gemmatimonadetes bacterium]|nr:hypothetical protein [Gemmatimonadota bacterium]
MLSALLTVFLVGLGIIVVAGIVLAILGFVVSVALGLAVFLMFKVAPILLVAYIVLRLIARRRRPEGLTGADRRWLERGD